MTDQPVDLRRAMRSPRVKLLIWRIGCGVVLMLALRAVLDLDWTSVAPSWLFLLTGLGRSWLLAIVAITAGGLAAAPLALARVYGPPGIRQAATALIECVRATPELMIVFWVYFTLPIVTGNQVTSWNAALGSLSVIAAVYLAEVFRAGLYSVPRGQSEASAATGMSGFSTFLYVILPQAVRNMVPALIAQLVGLFKTTSLVYAIGVMEFFRSITVTNNAVFAPYQLYLVLALGYFLSCFAITRIVRWYDPKYQLLE
ncbi:MAG TPA: amino acid ABC transporter permease [Stellaceae bacterium]|nr:amino acid ABC transporter permease [Stellaceae bacterium]